MGEIYFKAERVLIWLGESTFESEAAIRYLHDVYVLLEPVVVGLASRGQLAVPRRGLEAVQPNILEAIRRRRDEFQEQNRQRYHREGVTEANMLTELMDRRWFQRMWMLQELVMARSATFLCGESEISWAKLSLALGALVVYDQSPELTGMNEANYAPRLKLYQDLRTQVHQHMSPIRTDFVGFTMSWVLTLGRPLQCSKPKDKMYGLHGYLRALGFMDLPRVDYGKSVPEVFTEYTRAAMLHDLSAELLYEVGSAKDAPPAFESPGGIARLPSWVADWSSSRCCAQVNHEHFAASGASQLTFEFPGPGRLRLSGVVIDTVRACSETVPQRPEQRLNDLMEPGVYLPSMEQRVRAWVSWLRMALGEGEYPTGERTVDVFQRTILQDGAVGKLPEHRLPAEVMDEASSWVSLLAVHDEDVPPGNGASAYQLESHELWRHRVNEVLEYTLTLPAFHAAYFSSPGVDPRPILANPGFRTMTALANGGPMRAHNWILRLTTGRRMFRTQLGYFGTAPQSIRTGDSVALIAGMKLPMLVRALEDGDGYKLVCPAFVHGMMHGEFWPAHEGALSEFVFN
ncbi:hypothetical protein LTR85_009879 [Meristemomyces frigidus]|nr:hypothetical protein LTR85_009879 [Meristemomyces frigidus]